MTTLEIIAATVLPIVLGLVFSSINSTQKRMLELELRFREVVTIKDVRILISDKIDPLKEDIHEIKQKLDRLIELRESK